MATVRRVKLQTWEEMKRDLVPMLFERAPFLSGRYLFRGCGDAAWTLISSFDRQFKFLPSDKRMGIWHALLREFRNSCIEHGVAHEIVGDDKALLAFAQHHGLPTRLLDWSLSPYVAAFFAFRQALRSPHSRGQVALWVLDTRSSAWSSEMGVEVVAPVAKGNFRLRNQSGRFTYARTPHLTLEEYVSYIPTNESPLMQITLPSAEAIRAMPDLDAMGANAINLFPDWDGLAEGVAIRLQVEALASSDTYGGQDDLPGLPLASTTRG